MTVLKTWTEIKRIHKKCRPILARKVFFSGGLKETWPSWAVTSSLALLLLAHSLSTPSTFQNTATAIGSALGFIGLFLAKELYCKRAYPKQYRDHAIDKAPIFKRERLLQYALFNGELKNLGHNAKSIQEIVNLSEVAEDPEKPNPTSENLLLLTLATTASVIFTNLLLKTQTWDQNKGFISPPGFRRDFFILHNQRRYFIYKT